MVDKSEKPLAFVGSSRRDLMALPLDVRKFFGHALDFAQRGEQHDAAKVLKGRLKVAEAYVKEMRNGSKKT